MKYGLSRHEHGAGRGANHGGRNGNLQGIHDAGVSSVDSSVGERANQLHHVSYEEYL